MRAVLVLAAVLLVVGCHPKPPPVTPADADAGQVDAVAPPPAVNCGPATSHRQQLGCADQKNFLALCLNVNDQRFSDCISAAPSCPAMDSCDPALMAGAKRAHQ